MSRSEMPHWIFYILPTELAHDYELGTRAASVIEYGYICFLRDNRIDEPRYLPGCTVGRTPEEALKTGMERARDIDAQVKEAAA